MKLKRRRIKRGRVEIIPMIDTIVILLIFYMTFSRFVEASKEANLALPTSIAGVENKGAQGQVILNMYNKEEVYFEKRKYSMDEVPSLLTGIRQEMPPNVNMVIVLRGNRDMTYDDLSAFMKACAKARIADVTFTTEEKR